MLREPGSHTTRDGRYNYSEEVYQSIENHISATYSLYNDLLQAGLPPEHAREILPMSTRQDCQASGNFRAFLHFLDLRAKANAQGEIVQLATCIYNLLSLWCPEIMKHYTETRYRKGVLAP